MKAERLVIVGGPSCIGKSFLLGQIRSGNLQSLCATLGIDAGTPVIEAGALAGTEGQYPLAVLHYDFVRQMRGGRIRALPEAVDSSSEVTYVTLVASNSALRHRVRERLRRHVRSTLRGSWPALYYGARLLPALPLYYSPRRLEALYRRWYDFIAAHPGEHWVLDVSDLETSKARRAVDIGITGLSSTGAF